MMKLVVTVQSKFKAIANRLGKSAIVSSSRRLLAVSHTNTKLSVSTDGKIVQVTTLTSKFALKTGTTPRTVVKVAEGIFGPQNYVAYDYLSEDYLIGPILSNP